MQWNGLDDYVHDSDVESTTRSSLGRWPEMLTSKTVSSKFHGNLHATKTMHEKVVKYHYKVVCIAIPWKLALFELW